MSDRISDRLSEFADHLELGGELEGFGWIWYWRKWLPERKGQGCRVLARGTLNSILVEFDDGCKYITSRYAVRKRG